MSEETPQPCCAPEPFEPCDEHPVGPSPPSDRRPRPPQDLLLRLPPGARWKGAIRLPLSLRQAPRLHLVELAPGTLEWFLRLPNAQGGLEWRAVPLATPIVWARASGFPALALAMEALVGKASHPPAHLLAGKGQRGPG